MLVKDCVVLRLLNSDNSLKYVIMYVIDYIRVHVQVANYCCSITIALASIADAGPWQ